VSIARISFGPGVCGNLDEAARREWLVADGLGGYAMGTVAALRTRRYHGLLVVVGEHPGSRMLGLAALDPVIVLGDRRIRLATHEWTGGTVDPTGHELLVSFDLDDGVPRWRWRIGGIVLEREIAAARGRAAVGVVHRLLTADQPLRLELSALCTWRDQHGDRQAFGEPEVETDAAGFVFEGAYRVEGDGFVPGGEWYRGVRYREEAARGLGDREDIWAAGTFAVDLAPGEAHEVAAGARRESPPQAGELVAAARRRGAKLGSLLALAADRHVIETPTGPGVLAGYPWFGEWSRDTMISYEGLFLSTGRVKKGRKLLQRYAATLSEGMLANTADTGSLEFNTADATLWFMHAVGRHVEVTGDGDLAASLLPALEDAVAWHIKGTRYGIKVAPDGLLTQGADGVALTWMDARVGGRPVTPRSGKAVELQALWVNGLRTVARLQERLGRDPSPVAALAATAATAFEERFPTAGGGLLDVADPDDPALRPNQLLAVSLPYAPSHLRRAVDACRDPLLTPLGLRSLSPDDPRYVGLHRGGPAERDRAYHQGTVWPWLIGPYVEAAQRTGVPTAGVLDGLEAHLGEWGLGGVSETADGEPPHASTGCPFQAWSIAELVRARELLGRG
jgi:predicted glycogen debranching enzyme